MHWLIRECKEGAPLLIDAFFLQCHEYPLSHAVKTVDGIIDPITSMQLCQSCSDIRAQANDMNNYLFQEIPYPYAQVRPRARTAQTTRKERASRCLLMTCFLSSLRFVKVTTMLVKILMVCLVTSFTMKAAVYSTSEGSSACKLDDDYNPYGMGPPCCRFFEKQLRCCDDACALSLSR